MAWSHVGGSTWTGTGGGSLPAGIADGDLCICGATQGTGQWNLSGWTALTFLDGQTGFDYSVFWKIWATGDSTSVSPTGGSAGESVTVNVFRTDQTPLSFDASGSFNAGSNTSTVPWPTITTTQDGDIDIVLVSTSTTTITAGPSGYTAATHATTGGRQYIYWRERATAGATGSVTATLATGVRPVGWHLAFKVTLETDVPVDVTDDAALSLDGESVEIASDVVANDTGAVALDEESLSIDSAMDVVVSGTVSATESIDLAAVVTVGDAGTVSTTDTVTVTSVIDVAVTDAGTVSATDDGGIDTQLAVNVSDSGTVSATEAIALASDVTLADTATVSATETASVTSDVGILDAGTVSTTDTLVYEATVDVQVTDDGTVSTTDTVDVVLVLTIEVTDTGSVSFTETATVDFTTNVSVTDAGTVSAAEAIALASTIAAVDSGTVSATDVAIVETSRTVTDTGTVSATDTLSVVVTVFLSMADGGTISATVAGVVSTEAVPVIPSAGVLIGQRPTSYVSIPRVWLSDIYRTKLEDLTPARAMSATAEYNDDYDTKRRASLMVKNPDYLRDLQDWVILETTIVTQDGVETTYNLGHYLITGRDVTHDNHGRQGTVQGQDLTWLLSQATIDGNYTIPAGTDHGAAARTIILERGIPAGVLDIPDSGTATGEDMIGIHGDRWWRLITDVLSGGAMYQPWIGTDHMLRSRKVVDIATAPAVASYRQEHGAKIIPPVQNRPDLTRLRNRVTVRKVTPGEPIIQWTATVEDEGSRLHPANLAELMGSPTPIVLGETYDESAIATETEAKQLAEHRLSVAGSFIDRLNMSTYLDHTLDGHQILDVNLKDGHASYHTGNWLQRTWRVNLNGARASVDRELTRTTAWR